MFFEGGTQGMADLAMGSKICTISCRNRCRRRWRAILRRWVIRGMISGPPAIGFNHSSWFLRAGDHRFAQNTKLVFFFVFTAFSAAVGHFEVASGHTEVPPAVGRAGNERDG